MTKQNIKHFPIRSGSRHLRPFFNNWGYGESRRSNTEADGRAWGWGPARIR